MHVPIRQVPWKRNAHSPENSGHFVIGLFETLPNGLALGDCYVHKLTSLVIHWAIPIPTPFTLVCPYANQQRSHSPPFNLTGLLKYGNEAVPSISPRHFVCNGGLPPASGRRRNE